MTFRLLTKLLSSCLVATCLSACFVSHRVARPHGCRDAVYVDTPRGGYWRCGHHHHHHPPRGVILVR